MHLTSRILLLLLLALAWATACHLAGRVGAFTLFATHFFELTALVEQFDTVANVRLDAVESGDRIVFLHRVMEGPASQSYGLQVAALAGLPRDVLDVARAWLRQAEERQARVTEAGSPQADLFIARHPLLDAVAALDPDTLSPREALQALYHLRTLL